MEHTNQDELLDQLQSAVRTGSRRQFSEFSAGHSTSYRARLLRDSASHSLLTTESGNASYSAQTQTRTTPCSYEALDSPVRAGHLSWTKASNLPATPTLHGYPQIPAASSVHLSIDRPTQMPSDWGPPIVGPAHESVNSWNSPSANSDLSVEWDRVQHGALQSGQTAHSAKAVPPDIYI